MHLAFVALSLFVEILVELHLNVLNFHWQLNLFFRFLARRFLRFCK